MSGQKHTEYEQINKILEKWVSSLRKKENPCEINNKNQYDEVVNRGFLSLIPKRDQIINENDIQNLKIDLGITNDVNDFIIKNGGIYLPNNE